MPKRSRIDGLEKLISIVQDLRDLPRENFKATLKADLERRASMINLSHKDEISSSPLPEGVHTVTPYLVAQDAPGLIAFVKQVFDTEEKVRSIGSAGGLHCELRLGDSTLMIGGGGPRLTWRGESSPMALLVHVNDTDAVYRRALEAGGTSIYGPVDQAYGERDAGVKDQFGNIWYIATAQGKGYVPKGLRVVTPCLHPSRSEPLIDFLKRAFGAEEVEKYASPEGVVIHAKVRIGDSILALSDAHGPFQSMNSMFYLYVPNVDAAYRRALEAGATSTGAPANQPYGERVASFKDAFGNHWYIGSPIAK